MSSRVMAFAVDLKRWARLWNARNHEGRGSRLGGEGPRTEWNIASALRVRALRAARWGCHPGGRSEAASPRTDLDIVPEPRARDLKRMNVWREIAHVAAVSSRPCRCAGSMPRCQQDAAVAVRPDRALRRA